MTLASPAHITRPSSSLDVKILSDWSAFAKLAQPWNELGRAADSGPFVSHRWLTAWYEAFGAAIEPRILQVWRDGLLVAAAPLGISLQPLSKRMSSVKVRTLQMMSNHRTGYNQWLVAPGHEDSVSRLLDATMRETGRWSIAEFEPFLQSPGLDRLVDAARSQRIPFSADTTIHSIVVDLSKGWDAYLASRPREFRKGIRVARKRVQATKHRVIHETKTESDLLERVLALSARSWKGNTGTALGASEATRSFMRRLWALFAPTGEMELWLLEVDGEEVGSIVCIREGDTLFGFSSDFDERFGALSPGRFMFSTWLENAASRQIKHADLLRGTNYLKEFSDQAYAMSRLRLFPGRNAAFAWLKTEDHLRRISRQWRSARRDKGKRRAAVKQNQEPR